ncbi:hypothetical protein [Nonomuraea sp. NPDC050310]|uniref:hypothetical protein n=1 Tax=unclassified Nonomuraea TaxID=2593643 RepID=UPI0033EAA77B
MSRIITPIAVAAAVVVQVFHLVLVLSGMFLLDGYWLLLAVPLRLAALAWALREVLRLRTLVLRGALRVLLYLSIMYALLGSFLVDLLLAWSGPQPLGDAVEAAVPRALQAPLTVLLVLAVSRGRSRLRIGGLAFAAFYIAVLVMEVIQEVPLSGVVVSILVSYGAEAAWLLVVLAGQWADGRWSRTTVLVGAAAFLLEVLWLALLAAGVETAVLAFQGVGVIGVVWLARTARELEAPMPPPVSVLRPGTA